MSGREKRDRKMRGIIYIVIDARTDVKKSEQIDEQQTKSKAF